MAYYLDTSALVKLVVAEPETEALRAWLLSRQSDGVASDLVRTELARAVRRAAPDRLSSVRAVLDGLVLISCTTATFESAGRLMPATLRSLDALHLATALELGDDLDGMVTYETLRSRQLAAKTACRCSRQADRWMGRRLPSDHGRPSARRDRPPKRRMSPVPLPNSALSVETPRSPDDYTGHDNEADDSERT